MKFKNLSNKITLFSKIVKIILGSFWKILSVSRLTAGNHSIRSASYVRKTLLHQRLNFIRGEGSCDYGAGRGPRRPNRAESIICASRFFTEFCGAHGLGLFKVTIDLLVVGEIQFHCDLKEGEVGVDEQFFDLL